MFELYLPHHTRTVHLDDSLHERSYILAVPHKRSASPLALAYEEVTSSLSEDGKTESPLPRGGNTATQQNFVFLSGGYTQGGLNQFRKDLDEVIQIMQTSCDGCSNAANLKPSVPYRRYFTSFNVFAVWQASNEGGASIPTQGITVDNNLGCSYGTVVDRALYCTPTLVTALADTAPCGAVGKTNVVAIVLVNSTKYGGAASYRPTVRVGAFSVSHFNLQDSGQKGLFASLFFHETGHCFANLMDEYNMYLAESSDIWYPNCAFTQATGDNQWAPWTSYTTYNTNEESVKYLPGGSLKPSDEAFFSVSSQALEVCGWTNYWKPSSNCFMEKLTSGGAVPRFCPVCRQQAINMMYSTGMDISSPKCPLSTELLLIDPSSSGVYIFINSKIVGWQEAQDGGKVVAKWSCGSTTLSSPEPGYIQVTPTMFTSCGGTVGTEVNITVTLNDMTVWVSGAKRVNSMVQSYSWRVKMVQSLASYTTNHSPKPCINQQAPSETRLPDEVQPVLLKQTLDSGTIIDFSYKSDCLDPAGCTTNYATRQYNTSHTERPSAADDVQSLVFGLPGALCLVGVLMFLFSWFVMARKLSYSRVKSVYSTKYDLVVGIVRKTIVFSGLFFVIVSCVAAVWGMTQYNNVGAFLKIMLIAGFILCVALFVMAFVGATAAFYRAKNLLYLNAFGLLCSFIIMCYVTHVVIYVGNHITDSACGSTDTGNVGGEVQAPCSYEDTDIAICGIQGVGCELRELWKSLVKNYPDKICAFQEELKCSGYTQPCNRQASADYCPSTCDETNVAFGDACKVKLQDDIQKDCRRFTPLMVVLTIIMGIAMLNNLILGCLLAAQYKHQRKAQVVSLQSFTKRARQGKPVSMSGTQNQALRLMRALDDEQRVLMTKRFNQADLDKNGKLDLRELTLFLRAALSQDITKEEAKEAFRLADKNHDGTICFAEFRELFANAGGTEMETRNRQKSSPPLVEPAAAAPAAPPKSPPPGKYLDLTTNTYVGTLR
eukprot:TRINITY_DN19268_c0_g3_i1.p1 TRINITY_DN19268_c0_g3~~TRINITY_DN19268_c0_g3_i1.p1  ORF type:complete len:1129 (+),score=377.28 TRINITY_DN19268_c0_g3_i1:394-3387(+)